MTTTTVIPTDQRDPVLVIAYGVLKAARIHAYDTWMRRGWDTDQYAYERTLEAELAACNAAFTAPRPSSPAVAAHDTTR